MTEIVFDYTSINAFMNRKPKAEPVKVEADPARLWQAVLDKAVADSERAIDQLSPNIYSYGYGIFHRADGGVDLISPEDMYYTQPAYQFSLKK